MPSSRPTTATAGHSRPLARWNVDSSTPSYGVELQCPSPPAATQSRNSPTVASGNSRACSSARLARTGATPGFPSPGVAGHRARATRRHPRLAGHHQLRQCAAEVPGPGYPAELGQRGPSLRRLLGAPGHPVGDPGPCPAPGPRARAGCWYGPERPGGTRAAPACGSGAATVPAPRPPRRRRRSRFDHGARSVGARRLSRDRRRGRRWPRRIPGASTGGCRRGAGRWCPGRSSGSRSRRVGSAPFHP